MPLFGKCPKVERYFGPCANSAMDLFVFWMVTNSAALDDPCDDRIMYSQVFGDTQVSKVDQAHGTRDLFTASAPIVSEGGQSK